MSERGVGEGLSYAALIESRRLDVRAALERVIPAGGSMVWEVGSGHGHYLAAYAENHPTVTCIGIDIASDRVLRARRKQERAGLPNLHFIRAEAGVFLDALPPGVTFAAVVVLFPDPWPKLRHNKHRLLQPSFLAAVRGRMAPGARLYFRTDHAEYFDAARQAVTSSPGWRLVDEPWLFEAATVFQEKAESHQSFIAACDPE